MTEPNGVNPESVAEIQNEAVQQKVETPPVSDKEINFKALRDNYEALKRQNELLQMQMMQKQQVQEDVSMKEEDLLTYGEFKKLMQREQQAQRSYEEKIRDLEMRSKHADYEETIKNYLPDVLQEDPDLAQAIKDNPQMHKLAYKLAQASPKYHQDRLAKSNSTAVNKMVENANRPQPATARKSATIGDTDAQMKAMSDDDIWRIFSMAKARS